jgi:hypothetical protein
MGRTQSLSRFESARAVATELLVTDRETSPRVCARTVIRQTARCSWCRICPVSSFTRESGTAPTHQTSVYAQAISDAVDGDYRDGSNTLVSRTVLATTEWIGSYSGLFEPPGLTSKISAGVIISCTLSGSWIHIIGIPLSKTFVNMHRRAERIFYPIPLPMGGTLMELEPTGSCAAHNSTNSINEIPEVRAIHHIIHPLSVFYRAGARSCTPARGSV